MALRAPFLKRYVAWHSSSRAMGIATRILEKAELAERAQNYTSTKTNRTAREVPSRSSKGSFTSTAGLLWVRHYLRRDLVQNKSCPIQYSLTEAGREFAVQPAKNTLALAWLALILLHLAKISVRQMFRLMSMSQSIWWIKLMSKTVTTTVSLLMLQLSTSRLL